MTDRLSICFALSTPSRAPVSVWMTSCCAVTVMVSRLLADIEPDVDAARVVRAERHALRLVGLEPGELDLQIVGAGKDAGEQVLTAVVARHRVCDRLRARVRERDGRAGQDAAARVLNVARGPWRSSSPGLALCRSSATAVHNARWPAGDDGGALARLRSASQHGSPLMAVDGQRPSLPATELARFDVTRAYPSNA